MLHSGGRGSRECRSCVSTGRSIHAAPSITPSPREGIEDGSRLRVRTPFQSRDVELFSRSVEHRLGRANFRLANGCRRLDIHNHRMLQIDEVIVGVGITGDRVGRSGVARRRIGWRGVGPAPRWSRPDRLGGQTLEDTRHSSTRTNRKRRHPNARPGTFAPGRSQPKHQPREKRYEGQTFRNDCAFDAANDRFLRPTPAAVQRRALLQPMTRAVAPRREPSRAPVPLIQLALRLVKRRRAKLRTQSQKQPMPRERR
jgi:hypothetical protein